MRCEVVGDPPPTKIRWFKNEAPLDEDRPKITIRKIHAQVRGELPLFRKCVSRIYRRWRKFPFLFYFTFSKIKISRAQFFRWINFTFTPSTRYFANVKILFYYYFTFLIVHSQLSSYYSINDSSRYVWFVQTHEHAAKNVAGSRLKITNLDVSDVGFYTCRVTNGKDQIQSEGTLRVDSSKKWQGKCNCYVITLTSLAVTISKYNHIFFLILKLLRPKVIRPLSGWFTLITGIIKKGGF